MGLSVPYEINPSDKAYYNRRLLYSSKLAVIINSFRHRGMGYSPVCDEKTIVYNHCQ
jgi:hypothetical protein